MNWLVFTTDRQSDLDEINSQFVDRHCSPITTEDGQMLISAEMINDPFWSAYNTFLLSLPIYQGIPVFPSLAE